MRHWEQWQKDKTFEIDDKDRELCTLVMEIQLACQRFYFGKQAQLYFDNSDRDDDNAKIYKTRYDECYERLPDTFTATNVMEVYGIENKITANKLCSRLKSGGYVSSEKRGTFKKIKQSLQ